MSEEAGIFVKRARKLTDKAYSAAASAPKRTRHNSNYVLFKNAASGVTFRGSVFTTAPPTQPMFETKLLSSVALSLYDKAPQLKLSDDQLICYGCEVSGHPFAVTTPFVIGLFLSFLFDREDTEWFERLMVLTKVLTTGKWSSCPAVVRTRTPLSTALAGQPDKVNCKPPLDLINTAMHIDHSKVNFIVINQ
jgi:hypothetical protein